MCGVIFLFVRVWAWERDLVTILVSTISYLMYISVVMDYVIIRVLNLSSVLSSNGCNFHTDFLFIFLFVYPLCSRRWPTYRAETCSC